ncbi:hypothetical protein KNU14_gp11 [Gordonia phage Buggaboo]|uniref:Uncharacterized protein n=1 Tax=Gordonia phage Buggaboo TaxID=2315529 RepID=A0A386KFH6_9CAUD|nr:hypothetical protein KNU14_gp11 [Gordonia phage Buggaboo]AVE00670.1 hypothetical protein SEA_SUPERSULLEY_11 [Gordonia phage SuperSulley]AYD83203.1 hypothetical protein SEA_BUGGABOO_11 [Gordonia phage Buggaboo]
MPGRPRDAEPIKDPTTALRAFAQACAEAYGPMQRHPAASAKVGLEVDAFLAEWIVMRPIDLGRERAAQAEWQTEAKRAFAVMLQAIKAVGGDNLGELILAEVSKIYEFHGLSAEEEFERFTP